jgi:octaprenyl-diphosphate synthase
VLSYRRGDAEERAFWKRALVDGEQQADDLDRAIKLMARHAALEDTIERARHYALIARDALAIFPECRHRSALLEAVEFCVTRAH